MKKVFLSLLTVFLTAQLFSVNAQVKISDDFSYTISKPYKVVDGLKVYFSKGEEVLSIKYRKGMFYFQKFSGEKLNEEKRVDIPKMEPGFTFEEFVEMDGKIYFFYSRWDRANVKEQLFYREVDFDNCGWAGKEQLMFKIDGKITGGFSMFGSGSGKFSFSLSYDEQRLIIQYRKAPKEKRDALNKDLIGMHVYDKDLNEQWAEVIEMPYTEKKMNNLGYSIDGKGNAYLLAGVYRSESTRKMIKGKSNYDIELIRIDAEDQSLSHTKVKFDDKFVSAISFFEGKEGEIVLAGYYGNKSYAYMDGLFLAKVDTEGEITEKQTIEVPVEIMSMYMSQRAQDKMKKKDGKKDLSMSNMVLRDLIYNEDGSISIYGEKYFVVSRTDPKTGRTTYTYYYQEILVANIGADGELAWMTKLPKNQSGGAARGGMGFYVMSHGGYEYVLFLDNVKNIELPMNKYPKAHKDGKGGFLTGFKIETESGNIEKVSILNTLDAKGTRLYQFKMGRIINLSDGSIAIETYIKKKQDVMLRIKLND